MAINYKSTVKNDCAGGSYPTCQHLTTTAQSDNSTLRTTSTLSTIGFAVGAAGLVGGVVLYLTAPRVTKSTGVTVIPLVGKRDGGVAAVGSF